MKSTPTEASTRKRKLQSIKGEILSSGISDMEDWAEGGTGPLSG